MKKETWGKSDIGLIMVVVGLLLMMLVLAGCAKKPEYPPYYLGSDYLVSDCEWIGCLDEEYIEEICYRNHIDPNGKWHIGCPLCKHAFIEKTTDDRNFPYELSFCNFLFVAQEIIDKIEPGESVTIDILGGNSRVYCNKCLYPLGMDWRVFDWEYSLGNL